MYQIPLQNIQCYDYVLNYSYYDHTNNLVWNGQALPIMLGIVPSDHAWMSYKAKHQYNGQCKAIPLH